MRAQTRTRLEFLDGPPTKAPELFRARRATNTVRAAFLWICEFSFYLFSHSLRARREFQHPA